MASWQWVTLLERGKGNLCEWKDHILQSTLGLNTPLCANRCCDNRLSVAHCLHFVLAAALFSSCCNGFLWHVSAPAAASEAPARLTLSKWEWSYM
jgi:hypothetical protein